MTINVCKTINCPYFNPNTNDFGCQRYSVAPMCHLRTYRFYETQYALYAPDDYDMFDDVKASNDSITFSISIPYR